MLMAQTTDEQMSELAPGLENVSAQDALNVVLASGYWADHFPGDGLIRPTIVETWQPGWLGLRPHFLYKTDQDSLAHVEWHQGHSIIVLKPGCDGLTAVHEAAHVLAPGDREHGEEWAAQFSALVEVWREAG